MVFQATISARNPRDMRGLKGSKGEDFVKKLVKTSYHMEKRENRVMLLRGNKEKRRTLMPHNAHHVQCTIARNLRRVTYCNGKLPTYLIKAQNPSLILDVFRYLILFSFPKQKACNQNNLLCRHSLVLGCHQWGGSFHWYLCTVLG